MRHLIYICTAAIFSCACGGQKKNTEKAEESNTSKESTDGQTVRLTAQQQKSAGIEVGHPLITNINGTIVLQGAIDVPPQNTVSLSFPLGGYIKSTSMLPGKVVKKGQVLAVIEDMQFIQLQQDYLTAKTNAALADLEFARQQELNKTKASSDKIYEQAKAERERQQILVSSFSEKLTLIGIKPSSLSSETIKKEVSITSPINGFVSKVNITIGKYTSPTDILFELVDPSDIHLTLKVFESDINKIKIGGKVSAYSNVNPDKKYEAEVFLVNKVFDSNRMADIHCHFKYYEPVLVPGMFMNGEVVVQDVQALVVPENAVVRWENKHYAFIQKGEGQFKITEVQPGVQHEGKLEIKGADIEQQTPIVVKNAFALLMKIKNTEE